MNKIKTAVTAVKKKIDLFTIKILLLRIFTVLLQVSFVKLLSQLFLPSEVSNFYRVAILVSFFQAFLFTPAEIAITSKAMREVGIEKRLEFADVTSMGMIIPLIALAALSGSLFFASSYDWFQIFASVVFCSTFYFLFQKRNILAASGVGFASSKLSAIEPCLKVLSAIIIFYCFKYMHMEVGLGQIFLFSGTMLLAFTAINQRFKIPLRNQKNLWNIEFLTLFLTIVVGAALNWCQIQAPKLLFRTSSELIELSKLGLISGVGGSLCAAGLQLFHPFLIPLVYPNKDGAYNFPKFLGWTACIFGAMILGILVISPLLSKHIFASTYSNVTVLLISGATIETGNFLLGSLSASFLNRGVRRSVIIASSFVGPVIAWLLLFIIKRETTALWISVVISFSQVAAVLAGLIFLRFVTFSNLKK